MSRFSFRWGIDILDDGYVPVYNFMLRNYAKAGVTRNEFLCILHLAAYHYESPDGKAEPAQETIAQEMGYKHRNSVNNLIKSLKDKGMLLIEPRPGDTLVYNFAPFSRKMFAMWQEREAAKGGGAQPDVQVGANPDVQGGAQPDVHEEEEVKKKKKNSVASATAGEGDKPSSKKKDKEQLDAMYDAILEGSFGHLDDDLKRKVGGRVGQLRKYVVTAFPDHTADTIKQFYAYYSREVGVTAPRDLEKFKDHYVRFVQAMREGKAKGSNAPKPYVPKHVDVYVPPADVVNPVRQKETAA